MPITMIPVLIVSGHQSSRNRLTRLLPGKSVFRLMDVCADTHAAISIAAYAQPGIVIIDGSADPLAAIAATKKILSCSTASVIAVSNVLDADFAHHMLAAGALGYLTAQCSEPEFMTALLEVNKDNVYLCSALRSEYQRPFLNTPVRTEPAGKRLPEKSTPVRQSVAGKIAAHHWHSILQFTN